MEEMRLGNRERANSGIESSSLGFFNSYFYSGCDPAFDGISSTGSSCKTGHPQVRKQRGPRETPAEFGTVAGSGGEELGGHLAE